MIESVSRDYPKGFEYKGTIYTPNDLVVAEGEIGRIESVDLDNEMCTLVVSMKYSDRKKWNVKVFNSGLSCTMVGMRKATAQEKAAFERLCMNVSIDRLKVM